MATSSGAMNMAKLPSAIKNLVKELDDMDLDHIDKLSSALERLGDAASTLSVMDTIGLKFTAEGPMTTGAAAGPRAVNTGAAAAETVKIATTAAIAAKSTSEVTKEIVEIIKENITEQKSPAAAAATPEGVLVTRDVVVDLGREFDFRLRRKVEDIVENKLKNIKK